MNNEIVVAATDVDLTAAVQYDDGSRESILIEAGAGWYDQSGRIIIFRPDTGRLSLTRYALVPRSKPIELAVRFLRDMVLPAADSARRMYSAKPEERSLKMSMEQQRLRTGKQSWPVRKIQSLFDETRVVDCVYRAEHGRTIVHPAPLYIEMTEERRITFMQWLRA